MRDRMQGSKQALSYQFTFKRLSLLNRYYKITKFYPFVKQTALRGAIAALIFGLILLTLEWFFVDFEALFNTFVDISTPQKVFSFFFLSEATIGIIPPEVLIAWTAKTTSPWLLLTALATISYLGGIMAFFIGNRLFLLPALRNYIENKAGVHIKNLKKWGGLFVVIGAISPIPHSLVSMASGIIHYNFKHYLFWSLFRYVRFFFYAVIIFHIF